MKVLILADPGSAHTRNWIKALTKKRLQIVLFGFNDAEDNFFAELDVKTYSLGLSYDKVMSDEADPGKLRYLSSTKKIKKIISDFKPDIVHAHYASSYGLVGVLTGFHPLVLSAWGSDIMSFPRRSVLHRSVLKFILRRCDVLQATSKFLGAEVTKLSGRGAIHIPFGIDTDVFGPKEGTRIFGDDFLVIGIFKKLEEYYGVETLIRAYAKLNEFIKDIKCKLIIGGSGSNERYLKGLVSDLGLSDGTVFTGQIPYSKIPDFINSVDIVVNPSHRESFGVNVLEAGACGKPVILSDIEGLKEVYKEGSSAVSFKAGNVDDLSEKLLYLIRNEAARKEIGGTALAWVKENYSVEKCAESQISVYQNLIKEISLND